MNAAKRFTSAIRAAFTGGGFSLFGVFSEWGSQTQNIQHRELIQKISDRYNARTTKGAAETQMIVGFRSDWISGNGLSVTSENEANKDLIERIEEHNKISDVAFRNWAVSGQCEGRNLLWLQPEKERDPATGKVNICIRSLSWLYYNYLVASPTLDPDEYDYIMFDARFGFGALGFPQVEFQGQYGHGVPYDQLVYIKLGGEERFVNSPVPVLAAVNDDIEAISDCFEDMRKLNKKFGNAFLHFKTPDLSTADQITAQIRNVNWKPGTVLSSTADVEYVVPPPHAKDILVQEYQRRSQRISGTTGVPIHFMGLIDLFGTKAGAEDLTKVLNARTPERAIYADKIKELYRKIAVMDKALNGTAVDPDDFDVQVPAGTIGQMQDLVNVWLPLNQAGKISDHALRQRIPNYNPEEDDEFLEEEKADAEAKRQEMLQKVSNDVFGGNEDTPSGKMPDKMKGKPTDGGMM